MINVNAQLWIVHHMEPAPEPQLIQGFKELLVADASNEGVRLKHYVLKRPSASPSRGLASPGSQPSRGPHH